MSAESITVLHDFQYAGSCSISSNSYAFYVLLPACVREQHNSRCCSIPLYRTLLLLLQDAGCYCYDCCMAWRIVIAEAKTERCCSCSLQELGVSALVASICRMSSTAVLFFRLANPRWDKVILCFRQDRTFIRCRLGLQQLSWFLLFRLCSFYFSFCERF